MTTATATPTVVPNPGLHLTRYTVTLSKPGETYTYTVKTLCDTCRAKTSGTSSMGESINDYCDGCGAGPSVPHYRFADETPPTPAVTTRITFNRNSFDFDCYATVEGEEIYLGSRPNFFDGESLCRQYRYDAAVDSYCPEQAAAVAMKEYPCDCGVSEPSYATERAASTGEPWPHAVSLIPSAELAHWARVDPPRYRAALASLSAQQLEWQAAVAAAHIIHETGGLVQVEAMLAKFKAAVAIHHSGAESVVPDDTSYAIYELALTDPAALRTFLAGHSLHQRERLAWRFASYLRREHDIVREPTLIARNWDALIGSEEPQRAA